jgi:dTDP-glucose 4,6-dehydratase
MKKVLITGAGGFIGSNALDYFVNDPEYQATTVVDKLTYAADPARITKHPVDFYKFDISEANWDFILNQSSPDVVVNFAAESHVDQSIDANTFNDFVSSNYTGVGKIVHAIRRYKTKPILYVQVSTDEVLGHLPLDTNRTFHEGDRLAPNNVYAATKAAAEQLLRAMCKTYGDFTYVVVRATNNYGPNQHTEKFIPRVISNLLQGKNVPLYGNGKNVREWLWVEDFVLGIRASIDHMVKHPTKHGEVYHFGSGVRLSNLEVVRTILGMMNKSEGHIEFVPDRPGHDLMYALNSTKAHVELQWCPNKIFKHGISQVITDIRKRIKGVAE